MNHHHQTHKQLFSLGHSDCWQTLSPHTQPLLTHITNLSHDLSNPHLSEAVEKYLVWGLSIESLCDWPKHFVLQFVPFYCFVYNICIYCILHQIFMTINDHWWNWLLSPMLVSGTSFSLYAKVLYAKRQNGHSRVDQELTNSRCLVNCWQ